MARRDLEKIHSFSQKARARCESVDRCTTEVDERTKKRRNRLEDIRAAGMSGIITVDKTAMALQGGLAVLRDGLGTGWGLGETETNAEVVMMYEY